MLYFKSKLGKLHYFRGDQKITDIVKSGLWTDEDLNDDKIIKQIHWVIAKRRPANEPENQVASNITSS